MSEPLENLYFNWLCAKVINIRNNTPTLTYWNLFKILHGTEFVWLLSGDDNRAEDGLELRGDFIVEANIADNEETREWRSFNGCSLLEMFIAFSKRAEFMTDIKASDWFWEFIDNLGLKEFNDASERDPIDIAEILYTFIWRQYDSSGVGGFLPLDDSRKDQRVVQIWYQFCDYLMDHDRMP